MRLLVIDKGQNMPNRRRVLANLLPTVFMRRVLATLGLFVIFVLLPSAITFYRTIGHGQRKARVFRHETKRERLDGLSCRPKEHILFLKTHKTGGSTVTNILNRFGDKRNLAFALPANEFNVHSFRWPRPFQIDFVDMKLSTATQRKTKPDILNVHARYNQVAMERLMPADSAFITILRHPVPNFESTFHYYDFPYVCKITGKNNVEKLRTFFSDPSRCLKKAFQRMGKTPNLLRNGMMYDLGFEPDRYHSRDEINLHVEALDTKFTLVLILEHFDESLVLLKRKLCWKLEDVAYFKFLRRTIKNVEIPVELRDEILTWSAADKQLYDYFNKSLWREIEKYSSGFFDEVQQLRELNQLMKVKCLGETQTRTGRGGRAKVSYHVLRKGLSTQNKTECCRFIREELDYVDYHRLKQGQGWRKASPPMGC